MILLATTPHPLPPHPALRRPPLATGAPRKRRPSLRRVRATGTCYVRACACANAGRMRGRGGARQGPWGRMAAGYVIPRRRWRTADDFGDNISIEFLPYLPEVTIRRGGYFWLEASSHTLGASSSHMPPCDLRARRQRAGSFSGRLGARGEGKRDHLLLGLWRIGRHVDGAPEFLPGGSEEDLLDPRAEGQGGVGRALHEDDLPGRHGVAEAEDSSLARHPVEWYRGRLVREPG